MLMYREVDLAAAHHIVQEGVLSHQLHTQTQGHSVNESVTHAFMCILNYTQSMKLHTNVVSRK